MRSYISNVTIIAIACATLHASPASAQQEQEPPLEQPSLALKLLLGLGGEAEVDTGALGVNVGGQDDLEVTWGGGVQYMHPLHKYFALGAGFGIQTWQSDNLDNVNADRNVFVDVTLVPAGTLPLTRDIGLYVAVPFGPTIDFWSADEVFGGAVEVDPAFGFTLSLLVGGRFLLSEGFGLLAELGYVIHSFGHEVQTNSVTVAGVTIPGASLDFDVDLRQIALNAGVFF